MRRFLRVIHTVRYLKWVQIWSLLKFKLLALKDLHLPSFQAGHLNGKDFFFNGEVHSSTTHIHIPSAIEFSDTDVMDGNFVFAGESHKIENFPTWEHADASMLWRFNLHYFEWAFCLDWNDFKAILISWIHWSYKSKDTIALHPYPTSLRLQNWWYLLFVKHLSELKQDEALKQLVITSIYSQTMRLSQRLETSIQANHLLENAVALTLIGNVFRGKTAELFRRKGELLLKNQLAEQFNEDGFHYERSAMYHSRCMYALLLLCYAGQINGVDFALKTVILKGLHALEKLTHPDGEIVLFNDAGIGVYPSCCKLVDFASDIGLLDGHSRKIVAEPIALPVTGFYGYRNGKGDYIIFDWGAPSPDYQPGHAHAGVFSFEMSANQSRLIVDGGTPGYRGSEYRNWSRYTSAHNTVNVNGRNQMDVWGDFRMGRRLKVSNQKFVPSIDGFQLEGEHDGYACRKTGNVIHRRIVQWNNTSRVLGVFDRLQAHKNCRIESKLRFASHLQISKISETTFRLLGKGDVEYFEIQIEKKPDNDSQYTVNIHDEPVSQNFGDLELTSVLSCVSEGKSFQVDFFIKPLV